MSKLRACASFIARNLSLLVLYSVASTAAAQVFINEIHYDNDGTDSGEAIEVAGPAGTDLNGWSIVLYNGSNGAVYGTTDLSGVITNQQAGFGTVVVNYPANGIQNGSPDGIALVNAGTVIQFLSYEGTLTATAGPATGMTSTDIGFAEASTTPVGESLQLTGTGTDAADFTWSAPMPNTFGAPNTGQTFDGTDSPPAVLSTSPAESAAGVAADATIDINFNEDVALGASWFGISCTISGAHSATVSGGPRNYTLTPSPAFSDSETCTVTVFAAEVSDAADSTDTMLADFVFSFETAGAIVEGLVINEIDYDQPGTDAGEFVEIYNTASAGISLAGYTLELINGNGGAVYGAFALPAITLAPGDYFVVCGDASMVLGCNLDVSPNSNLVQNGAPDAVALVFGTSIVDTVSYEGDVPGYTEGSGAGLVDSSSGLDDNKSISRIPNGADTDQNNVDFLFVCATPGATNTTDAADCPSIAPPNIKINEIDYDQPGADNAEFVEIVNSGQGDADLSGIELRLVNGSNTSVYATVALPAITLGAGDYFVVCADALTVPNCDLEGFSSIQNGAPDAVALVLGEAIIDTVSYEGDTGSPYTEGSGSGLTDSGSTGQDFRSIGRFPNGSDTNVNNIDFVNACITPGLANTSLTDNCSALAPVLEIFQIQGDGLTSDFAGQGIRTEYNVVTAVGPDQFAMQTPGERDDADINTSNGIVVFTGGAPTVAVGDVVNVTGEVVEFFDFTEFSGGSLVEVVATGNPLPAAVTFDASVPSPDPTTPSCAIEYECYEGMLIEIANGTVTAANQSFGSDPVAEVYITAQGSRAFRETGIEFPGLPGLPVWDGNPEVFELDPDKLGLPNEIINAGSSFSATGVLGFEFGGYELWATSLSVTEAPLPRAVRRAGKKEIGVGSLNLFRLFDDIDDPDGTNAAGEPTGEAIVSPEEYQVRLAKFADYIVNVMRTPDIIGVQEVESVKVLQDLAAAIELLDRKAQYTAYLEEGNDIGGIDVGFLVRRKTRVESVTQLGADETYIEPNTGNEVLLNDRPPLLLEVILKGDNDDDSDNDSDSDSDNGKLKRLYVLVVHNRSLSGIEGSDGRVRAKRLAQSQSVAAAVQNLQTEQPHAGIVVVGDFNAYEFTDGYVDVVGQMRGDVVPEDNLLSGPDLVDPDLMNQVLSLPPEERYSFLFVGNAQALDHALTNSVLDLRVRGMQYARGNTDAARILIEDATTSLRSSDHDGFVLYIDTAKLKKRRDRDDDSDKGHDDDSDNGRRKKGRR